MSDQQDVHNSLICAGCRRSLVPGDRYIRDKPSGFMEIADTEFDGLIAEILGGAGSEVIYCEDCTEPGGKYSFEIYIGDAWRDS